MSWVSRCAPSVWQPTTLLNETQQDGLIKAIRAWGDEAKQWRNLHISQNLLTENGRLPHLEKQETNYFDGNPRTSSVTIMDKKLGIDISTFLLHLTPGIPVINEEASAKANQLLMREAKAEAAASGHEGPTYWVIDPIDGTDNFIDPAKREYSVLIGLVENGQPRFGMTYYPEYDELNVTRNGQAINIHAGQQTRLQVPEFSRVNAKGQTAKLEITPNVLRAFRNQTLPQDAALSHALDARSIRTNAMVGGIDPVTRAALTYNDYPNDHLLLTGAAHLSSFNKGGFEWDYAARHAILRAAGGEMVLKETGIPPVYGKGDHGYLRPVWLAHPQTMAHIGITHQIPPQAEPQAGRG